MQDAKRRLWMKYKNVLSYIISSFGLIYYAAQSWNLIHTLTSTVYDESGYMVRGYLLASGKYLPYADYSILLDHMPLSFLIPGYIQVIFGTGIRTGRYFTFVLGLISLIGLWIAARKLGGKWWATFAVWVFALNPGWIESYSLGYSQVLIFFFTTWAFVFLIGEKQNYWHIFIASFLTGLATMTRLNMLPVVFILILYIFWQHGNKTGIFALIGGLTPIVFFHILYWPGILRIWAFYFPEGILPLLDSYHSPIQKNFLPEGFSILESITNSDNIISEIIHTFWKGVQKNLVTIIGIIGIISLWPTKESWKTEYKRRLAIFLLVTYLILFCMHAWAALSGTSCGFTCFKGYLMFFTNIGLFSFILSFPYWQKVLPIWRNIIIGVFATYLLIELERWNFEWQRNLLHGIRAFLKIEVPLYKPHNTATLWGILEKIFAAESQTVENFFYTVLYWAIPLIFVWILIPLIIKGFHRMKLSIGNYGWVLLTSMLIIFVVISPLRVIGGELNSQKCKDSIIDSHEAVGERLNSLIPPGSKVYWALESWMIFLYIPESEIFPPQTMIHYNYVPSTYDMDVDFLLKNGYWNETLKEQWIEEADFILVEGRYYKDEWRPRVESGELSLVDITQPVEDCRGDSSRIVILQNNEEDIVSLFLPSPELPNTTDSRFEVGFLQAGKNHLEK
jgi:hypothetical protein